MRAANRKLRALAILATGLTVALVSPAQAQHIDTATIQNGQVVITGGRAPRNTPIFWESAAVGTSTNNGGAFVIVTTNRPSDCVGLLQIGSFSRFVVIGNCTPAPVYLSAPARTGQTVSLAAGDDGDLQRGVPWPVPRFRDNADGTINDNRTGLTWLKDANCAALNPNNWPDALVAISNLAHGTCGLADNSAPNDWRMPNRNELESLLDLGRQSPALPSGHPFVNFQSSYYWSSSSHEFFPDVWFAWLVNFDKGVVDFGGFGDFVIAVRGGP